MNRTRSSRSPRGGGGVRGGGVRGGFGDAARRRFERLARGSRRLLRAPRVERANLLLDRSLRLREGESKAFGLLAPPLVHRARLRVDARGDDRVELGGGDGWRRRRRRRRGGGGGGGGGGEPLGRRILRIFRIFRIFRLFLIFRILRLFRLFRLRLRLRLRRRFPRRRVARSPRRNGGGGTFPRRRGVSGGGGGARLRRGFGFAREPLEGLRDAGELAPGGEVAAAAELGVSAGGHLRQRGGVALGPERADLAREEFPGRAGRDGVRDGGASSRRGGVDAGEERLVDARVDGGVGGAAPAEHPAQSGDDLVLLRDVRLQRAELREERRPRRGDGGVLLGRGGRGAARGEAPGEHRADAPRRLEQGGGRVRGRGGGLRHRERPRSDPPRGASVWSNDNVSNDRASRARVGRTRPTGSKFQTRCFPPRRRQPQ